jgi:hypothetical protein
MLSQQLWSQWNTQHQGLCSRKSARGIGSAGYGRSRHCQDETADREDGEFDNSLRGDVSWEDAGKSGARSRMKALLA